MIIGHQRQIRYLERVLARGTLAHAYLFFGPEGVGKRSVAMAVAGTLLCENRSPHLGGCGSCEGCELVERYAHPDLILFSIEEPLAAEEGRGIGIKNIHELQRRLALSAWRGGRKVVIVDQADALSREAQAALLKTLEEPDAATIFFIITPTPDALLETIRSRSVPMSFTSLGDDAITEFVSDIPPARRRSIVALAAGRPGLAVRLARDKKFFEEFQGSLAEYAEVFRADLRDQFAFSERVSPARGRPRRSVGAAVPHSAERASNGARGEPLAIESFFEYLIRRKRAELLASPPAAEATERAGFLRSLLEHASLLQATTVNRRLVADSVFVELAARAGHHSA